MVKKVKEFNEQDLIEYIDGKFTQDVITFNSRCGKGVDKITSVKEALIASVQQGKRVLEEVTEGFQAYLKMDNEEQLDALIDVLVTQVMYQAYGTVFEKFREQLGDEEFNKQINEAVALINPNDLLVMEVLNNSINPTINLLQGVGLFSPKRIYINCELILANNASKYTSDKAVADDWAEHLKEGEFIESNKGFKLILDGSQIEETFYCIKRDSDLKICKPYNFQPVSLEIE